MLTRMPIRYPEGAGLGRRYLIGGPSCAKPKLSTGHVSVVAASIGRHPSHSRRDGSLNGGADDVHLTRTGACV